MPSPEMTIGGTGSTWLDPAPYRALLQCGRRGLAWEVLRRNPGYDKEVHDSREYRRHQTGPIIVKGANSGIATRWGLHFRGVSCHHGTRCSADLVGQV